MAENIATIAAQRPDVPALIDERGETTWSELNARVNRLIHALRGSGIDAGSTVGILSGNRREYFEILAACAHASLVAVPINWHFLGQEVAYVLDNADAQVLIAEARFGEVAAAAATNLERLRLQVLMDSPTAGGVRSYEELLDAGSPAEPEDQGQGGVMFYTSGTTGRPKGVRSASYANLGGPVASGQLLYRGFSALLGVPSEGVTLLCGPLYHSAQWAFSQFPLGAGSTTVMRHKFVPEEALELIDRYGVTNTHLVPTQFVRLLRADDARRAAFDGSSLKVVWHGAAPCPPEVKRRMIEWWGPIIWEYYGGTEGTIVSLIGSEEWLERPTSVGKPLPLAEVVVVDDGGEPCTAGEAGQIYLRSRMGMDFEYHKDPDKTASVHLAPGLFTMGDVGFLDADGFLHLCDRKIDMIISGGVNIYPAEVEMVLANHPAVRDVAVFGIPDPEFGEQVKAAVELADALEPSAHLVAELIAHCREHLAGYKAPRSIDFETELPRQPTGKLYKRQLRDRYWPKSGRKI